MLFILRDQEDIRCFVPLFCWDLWKNLTPDTQKSFNLKYNSAFLVKFLFQTPFPLKRWRKHLQNPYTSWIRVTCTIKKKSWHQPLGIKLPSAWPEAITDIKSTEVKVNATSVTPCWTNILIYQQTHIHTMKRRREDCSNSVQ